MLRLAVALMLACMSIGPAVANPAEKAERLYASFILAQYAHDLARMRALLLDGPGFLWVTNGLSAWGADAAITRMTGFQAHEVWRIDPDPTRARAVAVAADTAFLHVPLLLTVGPSADPQRYRILVSALCAATPMGWRIAALFTTDETRDGVP